ncbi:MAG TPA: right-handed parallel beta-helix repeat-containing protein [Candidatus Hydrogenedentes bacterium]|nr:right-handed parallel beta-helix repeat-containing protein [Candidatus Hydrogenedentota bacterium]
MIRALSLLFPFVFLCSASMSMAEAIAGNPQAIADLQAGRRSDANAAWWGFDREDSTEMLQAALDSGADRVVIPYTGAPWITRPLVLRSHQTVFFEPGVVVEAKKGAFLGKSDSLFRLEKGEDLTLLGYGATLRMHKEDYLTPGYDNAEWRMTLSFTSCRRIHVEGVTLESSGGDGIYLGNSSGEQPWCEDVVIRNVRCMNHHRQGISVITAKNLLIENCLFADTDGTAPRAGIDFEPNQADERIENCVVKNCVMENNAGPGILVYLMPLSRESAYVSLRFENCHVRSGRDAGISVGAIKDDGPGGLIEFVSCTVENTYGRGLHIYDKGADRTKVRFTDCRWSNTALRGDKGQKNLAPLVFTLNKTDNVSRLGGVEFIRCRVFDPFDRPVLIADTKDTPLSDIEGTIQFFSPTENPVALPDAQDAVTLSLEKEISFP